MKSMRIGRSIRFAMLLNDRDFRWLAKKLKVVEGSARNLTQLQTINGKNIDALARVFNMDASKFIALGEQEPEDLK